MGPQVCMTRESAASAEWNPWARWVINLTWLFRPSALALFTLYRVWPSPVPAKWWQGLSGFTVDEGAGSEFRNSPHLLPMKTRRSYFATSS